MTLYAWKLTPYGGLHLGREGLEQETSAESFPSDSLFSAMIAQSAQLYGTDTTEQLLDSFAGSPPFRLSSLFPMIGRLALLPRPFIPVQKQAERISRQEQAGIQQGKRLKKITYVSPAIFNLLLDGTPLADAALNGQLLNHGRILISPTEQVLLPDWLQKLSRTQQDEAELWNTDTVPRVTIDRITNASQIYRVGRTVYAQECGLWLLADIQAYFDLLLDSLEALADTGIGGERSAGYGGFSLETIPPPDSLKVWERNPAAITLSRYNPTLHELENGVLNDAAYELVDIGGWMYSPNTPAQRRKRVRFIEAGAFLNTQNLADITGRLVDVKPHYEAPGAPLHRVIRSGLALCVGAKEAS